MMGTGLLLETKFARGDSGEPLLVESSLTQEGDRLRTYLDANLSRVRNGKCEWNIAVKRFHDSLPTSDKRWQGKLRGFGCLRCSNRSRAVFGVTGQKSGEYFVDNS